MSGGVSAAGEDFKYKLCHIKLVENRTTKSQLPLVVITESQFPCMPPQMKV